METHTIQKYFTQEEANNSLAYVEKIAKDMMSKWKDIMNMPERERESNLARMHEYDCDNLLKSSFPIDELRYYTNELIHLGCLVRSFENGSIAFPTLVEGKRGYYLWQYGEATVEKVCSIA